MSIKRPFRDDEDEPSSDASDFEAMLNQSFSTAERKLKVGDRIKGEVLSVGKERTFVSTGTRYDGQLPTVQLLGEDGQPTVKAGDTLEAFVTFVKGSEIQLSMSPTAQNLAADLQEAFSQNRPVEGRVEAVNKGGFQVTVFGKQAFCPFAQMDLKRIDQPEEYVGKKLEFKISKLTGRDIVLSRRQILEDLQGASIAGFQEQRQVGDVVMGTVTRIEPFGAFVEIAPGVEGLAHVSELAWTRVSDPKEVVTAGQAVKATIIRIEPQGNRLKISLSLKQAASDPWKNLPSQVQAGRVVTGKITRCMAFGAFVELAAGLEGLVPLSEMSNTKRVARAEEVVKEGDTVTVLVKGIDPAMKRISLSLKGAVDQAASESESQDIAEFAAQRAAREAKSGSGGLMAAKLQAAMAKAKKG
jgi:small subunit ribosomal protein S1